MNRHETRLFHTHARRLGEHQARKLVRRGLVLRRNPRNGFVVGTLAFTAHPDKRGDWVERFEHRMPPWAFRREMFIDYAARAGQRIYTCWSDDLHLVPPRPEIFTSADAFDGIFGLAFDFGITNPTACLLAAIHHSGQVEIVWEHYETGHSVRWHAWKIRTALADLFELDEQERELEEIEIGIDPEGRTKRRVMMPTFDLQDVNIQFAVGDPSGRAFMLDYAEEGIYITKGTSEMKLNDVEAGLARTYRYLETLNLTVWNTCHKLAWEIPNQVFKEQTNEDRNLPEKPQQKDDHAADALRYLMMTRPETPSTLTTPDPQAHLDSTSRALHNQISKLRRESQPMTLEEAIDRSLHELDTDDDLFLDGGILL